MSRRRFHEFIEQFDAGDDVPDWLLSVFSTIEDAGERPILRFSVGVSVFRSDDAFWVLPHVTGSDSIYSLDADARGNRRIFKFYVPDGLTLYTATQFLVYGPAATRRCTSTTG